MSGEALYERYKDALRRGHVASLRGRLEEALTAYAEAAAIAPERATPHTSAGTALMRRKRPADAVRHYTAAVRLAPRDEAALLGRAQALTALDRRAQAADAYDAVAEVQAANGKLSDAVDSARRGLEMAEGRERRRTLERLIERLRASEPAEPGRVALERAMVVLEGRAIEPRKAAPPAAPRPAAPAKQPPAAKDAGTAHGRGAAGRRRRGSRRAGAGRDRGRRSRRRRDAGRHRLAVDRHAGDSGARLRRSSDPRPRPWSGRARTPRSRPRRVPRHRPTHPSSPPTPADEARS